MARFAPIRGSVEISWDGDSEEGELIYTFIDTKQGDTRHFTASATTQWHLQAVPSPIHRTENKSLVSFELYPSAIDQHIIEPRIAPDTVGLARIPVPIGRLGNITLYPGSVLVLVTTGTMYSARYALYHLDTDVNGGVLTMVSTSDLVDNEPEDLVVLSGPIRDVIYLPIPLVYPRIGKSNVGVQSTHYTYIASMYSVKTIELYKIYLADAVSLLALEPPLSLDSVTASLLRLATAYNELL